MDAILEWRNELRKHCEKIPVALVGNKADYVTEYGDGFKATKKVVIMRRRRQHREMPLFYTSAKAGFQMDRVYVWVIRQIMGDPGLELLEGFSSQPAIVSMDEKKKTKVLELEEEVRQRSEEAEESDDDEV